MANKKLTGADFVRASKKLMCSVAAIKAVSEVESNGGGFLPTGEPVILFERHIFSRRTNKRFDGIAPDISNPLPGGYGAVLLQHKRLQRAVALDRNAALMSASWGMFQIMGFNYPLCGFNSLQGFVNAMYESEGRQLDAFVNYIIASRLDDELRELRWADFARKYNGPAYAKNKYDIKMAAAYKRFAA